MTIKTEVQHKYGKEVRHTKGPSPCGQVAFYYSGPTTNDVMRSKFATFPDGTKPGPFDSMYCGSCRQPIKAHYLDVMTYINEQDSDATPSNMIH